MELDPEGIEQATMYRMAELADASVLEIGCGDGRLVWQMTEPTANVVGIDPDWQQLSQATSNRPELIAFKTFFTGAMCESLPFVDKTFDGAVFGWSL